MVSWMKSSASVGLRTTATQSTSISGIVAIERAVLERSFVAVSTTATKLPTLLGSVIGVSERQVTLYEAVGGEPYFTALVAQFYAAVAEDDVLRPMSAT